MVSLHYEVRDGMFVPIALIVDVDAETARVFALLGYSIYEEGGVAKIPFEEERIQNAMKEA